MKKQIELWLPKGLNYKRLKSILKSNGYGKYYENTLLLYHYIITGKSNLTFQANKKNSGANSTILWVQIPKRIKQIIFHYDYYSKILELLEKNRLLTVRKYKLLNGKWVDFYVNGSLSKCYDIPNYNSFFRQKCTNKDIIKKLSKIRLLPLKETKVELKVAEEIQKLKLRTDPIAMINYRVWFNKRMPNYLKNHSVYDYLKAFNDNDFEASGYLDRYSGRLHTKLSFALPSVFRQFLYHEDFPNEELYFLDIANSQPFFVNSIRPSVINLVPQCKEVIDIVKKHKGKDLNIYETECINGTIYEYLKNYINKNYGFNVNRDTAKQTIFAGFFGDYIGYEKRKKNIEITRLKKLSNSDLVNSNDFKLLCYRIFKELFPTVWRIFDAIKGLDWDFNNSYRSKDYSNNCLLLQLLEKTIFFINNSDFEGVCKRCFDKGIRICGTIHDCVIAVGENDAKNGIEIMKQVFEDLQMPIPKIKMETY